jgi:hypothetical protein
MPTTGRKREMERLTNPEMSLTEASRRSGVVLVVEGAAGSSMSNARKVPYAELYRQSNAIRETPAQRIQRAAEEDAVHRASNDE